jgi:hypothetical protein
LLRGLSLENGLDERQTFLQVMQPILGEQLGLGFRQMVSRKR